jgi:hypothetical protein
VKRVNQSIDQSINRSIDQSINQSINHFAGVATLEASARRTAKTHTSSPSSNDQRF